MLVCGFHSSFWSLFLFSTKVLRFLYIGNWPPRSCNQRSVFTSKKMIGNDTNYFEFEGRKGRTTQSLEKKKGIFWITLYTKKECLLKLIDCSYH